MRDLTLRQVEVIRAVMMTGTIAGAADFLNVSAPGISRLLKHTEESLGVRLFERKAGLFVPAAEAATVFEQIHQVYEKMGGLTHALASLKRGREAELAFASVPSVAQFLAAGTVRHVRRRFPELYIDLNVLKLEEAVDYLLLERGEFVGMSYHLPHPSLDFRLLGTGQLVAIVPEGHRLAEGGAVAIHDLAGEPLIGVDDSDPYGAITAEPFRRAGLARRLSIRGASPRPSSASSATGSASPSSTSSRSRGCSCPASCACRSPTRSRPRSTSRSRPTACCRASPSTRSPASPTSSPTRWRTGPGSRARIVNIMLRRRLSR